MNSNSLLTLKDLSEYRMVECFYAQLDHGLMGFFPAIINKTKEMFVCTGTDSLEKILRLLPKRKFKISKSLMLVNATRGHGFDLGALCEQHKIGQASEPMRVLSPLEVDEICKKESKGFFKWAPGLIGDDMSREEFAETLAEVMATGSL